MSRIINRLAEASGGWEVFLYQTLRDVCKELNHFVADPGIKEIVEEAQEILTAYESLTILTNTASIDRKKIEAGYTEKVKITSKPVESSSGIPFGEAAEVDETKRAESRVERDEDVEWKLEDLVLIPAPRPKANFRSLVGRVGIDKHIGGSQGELPVPESHKLVNRQAITITTLPGMVIGTACGKSGEEGQIKSQHVTGHISVTGKYRLAFTDTTLGAAHVNYDVVALPTKLTSRQYEEAIASVNKLSLEELLERLKHFGLVLKTCLCGKEDCFGWQVVDKAILEVAKVEQSARLQAARNAGIPGPISE